MKYLLGLIFILRLSTYGQVKPLDLDQAVLEKLEKATSITRQFEEGNRPRHMPDGLTEAVFDVINEVFDIEYVNGDKYRGELAGDKRHGVGMYTYADGLTVIGYFKDNFLDTDEGERHPHYEGGNESLVPMSFEKY